MFGDTLSSLAVGPILFAVGTSVSAAAIVFSDDFDGGQSTAPGVTAVWSGVTTTEAVQDFDTVGFADDFLRNTTGGVHWNCRPNDNAHTNRASTARFD